MSSMTRNIVAAATASAVLSLSLPALAATEIQWWHAFSPDGKLGQTLIRFTEEFNASQSDYKVMPVHKGTYTETMNAAIAAYRAKKAPTIVQVVGRGAATRLFDGLGVGSLQLGSFFGGPLERLFAGLLGGTEGVLVVLAENVLLHLDHARLAHPRRMGVCRPLAIVVGPGIRVSAMMIVGVQLLGQSAARAIERGRIYDLA